MFARVFSKVNRRFFKSIIYCSIDVGYYRQYVVINPYTNCFELIDYLDKSDKELKPLVEIIQDEHDEWLKYENALLLKYKDYCKKHGKVMGLKFLCGYQDVCENFDFLTAILENTSVPVSEANIHLRQLPDMETWNYIQTQGDANDFMEIFAGFHDSTLDKLFYEECDSSTKVTVTFDNSGWYGVVELCFEGVVAINTRPPKENYSRYISEATLLVKNEEIFWADWYMENEDLSYDGSYIKALNLKWRKID